MKRTCCRKMGQSTTTMDLHISAGMCVCVCEVQSTSLKINENVILSLWRVEKCWHAIIKKLFSNPLNSHKVLPQPQLLFPPTFASNSSSKQKKDLIGAYWHSTTFSVEFDKQIVLFKILHPVPSFNYSKLKTFPLLLWLYS